MNGRSVQSGNRHDHGTASDLHTHMHTAASAQSSLPPKPPAETVGTLALHGKCSTSIGVKAGAKQGTDCQAPFWC
eukprot:scaffold27160_cov18-Tisochrysis_lutea.AAC.3